MSEGDKVEKPSGKKVQSVEDRFEKLKKSYSSEVKKLLLIRPKVPGDKYTELGSYNWAGAIKQKAVDEGWRVKDLGINKATCECIEKELNKFNPSLVIHYDHGLPFTLFGQKNDEFEPVINEANVGQAAGMLISTVSCLSASGLGPAAIRKGVKSYIGYTDYFMFDTNRVAEFGAAANAANFALLEGKTSQEAFHIGWQSFDNLITRMIEIGDETAAHAATHDRDCIKLLGDPATRGYMPVALSFGQPAHGLHGGTTLPDQVSASRKGPITESAKQSLIDGRLVNIPKDILDELVKIDWNKVPIDLLKSFQAMLDKMKQKK